MGWFRNLFRSPMDRVFENCDFYFARFLLRERLAGGVLKRELVASLDAFDRDPSRINAEALIRLQPGMVAAFHDNLSDKRFLVTHNPVRAVRSEPEYDELVSAALADEHRFRQLAATFQGRGYTPEAISTAIDQSVQASAKRTLRTEPEFEELADTFIDNKSRHEEIVAKLSQRGYTRKTILDSVIEHWSD